MPRTLIRLRSLRMRFSLAMGAFGIAVGALASSVVIWHLEAQLRHATQERLHTIAQEAAGRLEQSLASRLREVALLADMAGRAELLQGKTLQPAIDLLRDRQSAHAWIGITDADGRVLAASDGLLMGADVSQRPWFRGGLKGAYLGDPHTAVLLAPLLPPDPSGEPPRFVDVAVPLVGADGRTVGVVGAHLHWTWLRQLVERTRRLHANMAIELLVVDADGHWLIPPRSAAEAPPASTAAAPTHARLEARARLPGPADAVSDRAALAWTVVVRQPLEVTLAPLQAQRRFLLVTSLAMAALFALGTWWIAGRAVRPVERLAESARRHAAALEGDSGGDETLLVDQALQRLARLDPLTEVANRASLTDRLAALAPSTGPTACAAVLLVDLDDFGTFNNSQGREAGDALLRAVAVALATCVRPSDLVARLGGDQFALLLEQLGEAPEPARQAAEEVARRVEAACRGLGAAAGQGRSITASVGLMVFQPDRTPPEVVLKDAELALREAKRRGGSCSVTFSADLHARFDERVQLDRALRAAIPTQLRVLYQPQVDVEGRVFGAELLVRWEHPEQGMVSPARFIPLAEETGLIVPIGQWVLETACRQIAAWSGDPRRRQLMLSVNVSAREFAAPDYVERVRRTLADTGADARRLELELTESALATDLEAVVDKMQAIRALGVRFALDDFGTGFSSLSYLKRMPLDQLKIDQSFVRELGQPEADSAIVRAVIALGQGLGLHVIAEGVETQTHRDRLGQLGCSRFQGWLHGRPMPLAQFEQHTAGS